jgi:hypothetical protein
VQTAADALNAREQMPWYDKTTESVRPVDIQEPDDQTHRDSDWNRQDQSADETYSKRQQASSGAWGTLLSVASWLLLAVVLVAVVLLLASAVLRMDTGDADSLDVIRKGDADRVENLPFPLPSSKADFQTAARQCRDSGDFDAAIIYLFSYQLVEMDRHHLIRLARGKTNRQYLRELRTRPELQGILAKTILAFEEVFFGRHSLSAGRFEQCWQQLDRFNDLVRQDAA